MKKRGKFSLLFLLVFFIFTLAYSLSRHGDITDFTIDIKIRIHKGDKWAGELNDFRKAIRSGCEKEDHLLFGITDAKKTMTHFYDPIEDRGISDNIFPNAKTKAKDLYKKALKAYQCKKKKAWEKFGHALHLLQDMGAPSHVHNASHVITYLAGVGYEHYIDDNWDKDDMLIGFLYSKREEIIKAVDGMNKEKKDIKELIIELARQTYPQPFDKDLFWTTTLEENRLVAKLTLDSVIIYGAALINKFIEDVKTKNNHCKDKNNRNDNPDDNFSVHTSLYDFYDFEENEDYYQDLCIRTGIKKGLITLYYTKKAQSMFGNLYTYAQEAINQGDESIYSEKLNEFYNFLEEIDAIPNLPDYEEHYERGADIAILNNGYSLDCSRLFLDKFKEPVRLIEESFSAETIKDQPILVIPSGGLLGLEASLFLKGYLKNYVELGGVLIVFSQQHGYELSVLPTPDGKPLGSYGWREDQSCQHSSIYVATWHPALSSLTNFLVSAPVDGYFANYPSSSIVLLRRSSNGLPAMLAYPYGEGLVVVTSLYEDWGVSNWQSTISGRAIVRDLASWAKNIDLEMPEYNLRDNPEPEAALNLKVMNITEKTASNVKILWLDPYKELHFEEEKLASIPPGEEIDIPVNHTFNNISDYRLGIWHVDYILYDSEGDEIQPQAEANSGRFILSRPPSELYEVSDLTVNVTIPDEEVCLGSQVSFKAHFTNQAVQEKRLHLWWDLMHYEAEYEGEIAIPGDSSLTEEITIDLSQLSPKIGDRFWLHIFEENGKGIYRSLTKMFYRLPGVESWTYVGSVTKGFMILPARVEINTQAGKDHYNRGEAVDVTLNIKNKRSFAYDSTINLRMTDPFNRLIHQSSWIQHLASKEEAVISESFTLPHDADIGIYFIYVEALDYKNDKIGSSHSLFELPAFQIKSEVQLPSILQPNSSNTVSFVLTNIGEVAVSEGILDVRLLDSEEKSVFQAQQGFSLAPAHSTTFNFNVPLSDIKFGDYKLFYPISSEFGTGNPVEIIVPSEIDMDLDFDKTSYRMRDEMNLSLNLKNNGKFFESIECTVSIASFPYSESRSITLNPGGEANLSFSTVVPINIGSGLHSVEVALKLPSGSEVKKSLSFSIPVSSLSITSDKTEFVAGENLAFQIANPGGVDTSFEYEVKLYDLKHKTEIHTGSGTGIIQAGAVIPLTFTIPLQALDGHYYLKIDGTDNSTGKKRYHTKDIEISGVEADLEVNTDKDIYLSTEQISSLSKIVNSDKAVTDGTLHLQVLSRELGKEQWNHYHNPLAYIINDIAIDRENNIWFGTNGAGVSKFDGTHVSTYNELNSGLADDYIDSITVDLAGNIWFGTKYRGVSKFDGTNWTTYNRSNSGLASNYIDSIAVDSEGNLWIGTSWGLNRFDGTNWTTYTTSNSGLVYHAAKAITCDLDGNMWFGTSKGVSKFDGTDFTTYTKSNSGLVSNYIYSIAVDSEGNLWFGTNWYGVSKFDGTSWKTYTASNSELIYNSIYAITSDLEGKIWFGTSRGVSRFDGTNWTTYTESNSRLADDDIHSIAVDSTGNVWFGTYNGTSKFDGTNWKDHTDIYPGISSDDIYSISSDKEGKIWFGTDWGVNEFNGIDWTNYTTSNSGLVDDYITSIAADLEGNLWVGTWDDGVSKFDGTNWTTYTTSNSGLADDDVWSIAVDLEGNIWLGTWYGGASKFDGTNWTTFDEDNSGLVDDRVYSLAVDLEGNIWFGTWYGVSKFDGTNWTSYNAYYSELVNNYINSIAVDLEGNIWFGTDRGVSKFDGTNWTTYDTYNSGIVDDEVYAVAVDLEGNIWFGTRYGVSKFDGTDWTTYDAYNSGLLFDYVWSIAVDVEGNLWFGTGEGVFNLTVGSRGGKSLWQKDISINQGASETEELTTEIGQLNLTGKFFLEGKLESSIGQTISEAEYPFYVTESNEVLLFSPDKTVYKQGETVSIQGEVKNLASAEASDLTLTITKESVEPGSVPEEVYSETFSVPAGESHPFSFTIDAGEEGTYVLTGVVTQSPEEVSKASEQFQVSNPYITAAVTAPEIVGLNPFDITVELENTGLIEGIVMVNIQPVGLSQEVAVGAGETQLVILSRPIVQTTAFEISFTGDHEETVTKNVLYGLNADILVTPQASYGEGRVEVPVKVTNTGPLENEVGIDFTLSLNGTQVAQLTRAYYLPFNQLVEDSLGFDINAGTYTLTWSSLSGSAQASFEVKPLEKMEMAAALGAQTEGVFPLNINLENSGFDDFSGNLSIESEIYSSFKDITLASGVSNIFTFSVILEGAAEGEYSLLVKLLRLDNTTVLEQAVPVTVTRPQLGLTSVPAGLSFNTGEDAFFLFTLKNTGTKEGRGSLKVEVMDMESEEELYLGAGQGEDLSFTFLIPNDLPVGDYVGKYALTQEGVSLPVQGEFKFNVQGIDIDVEAQLDKNSYMEGETAVLTLTVTNNSQSIVDLFAKVKFRDYEGEQSFTLDTSSSLDFSIPLPEITEEKAFFGIYHQDGRGIHLNDIYIYRKEEGIELLTDKQVYDPGETVTVLINSTKAGQIKVESIEYEEEFTIEGNTSRSFTLSSDILGGTYGVNWEFFPSDGSGALSGVHLFDVAGLKVVVTEVSLDKSRYSPGETIQFYLVFESNQDIFAQVRFWIISPEDDYTDAGSKQISLSAAEHTIAVNSLAFDSSHAGIHRVVYALYTLGDKQIVSGAEAFDCGGGVVLGVSTEKKDYLLGTEEVKAYVNLFGDGEAPLVLFIDDVPVKTVTVSFNSVITEEIILEPALLGSGTLVLKAELQKDGLTSSKQTSFSYGSTLPDLTLGGLTYESENLDYTIRAEALNLGLTQGAASSVAFFEGDPDAGGELIQEVGIGALDSGGSVEVEIEWDGKGKSGDREIYAVVDRSNAVKEFNEENNESYLSLSITELFHELRLDKLTFSAFEDFNIVSFLINNKNTTIQGQLALKITNLSSAIDIWEHSEAVSPVEPYAQSLISNIYNLGPIPEGEYRITQTLTLDGKEIVDGEIISVLKTEKVAGTFTLEPAEIKPNQDEEVLVSLKLQNRGNVGIEGGTLILEIEKKETGQKVDEKQIEFDLDISESKDIQETVTLNLEVGFYIVKLLLNEEILDKQELEVKFQIIYTKEESLVPRVLILTGLKEKKSGKSNKPRGKKGKDWIYYSQLFLIEQALDEAGISYKIETKTDDQVRELRSGAYNIVILLDDSKGFSHIKEEIKERVWRGEGVIGILTNSDSWKKDFIKEIFGIEVKVKKEPKEKKKTVETYATPVSAAGEFTLQSSFVELKPKAEDLIIIGKIDKGKKPAMTLYHYGEGRAVASGFVLAASPGEPAHEALKQILLNSFAYLKPQEETDATISRIIPVEMTFQNPSLSAITLKIEEEIPTEVKLISAEPELEDEDVLTWEFTLEPSDFIYLRYEVELPDLKGEYPLKTNIIKVEGTNELLMDTSVLSYSVEKTVREFILETIIEVEKLPITSPKDMGKVRKVVEKLSKILSRDETKHSTWKKNLDDILKALEEVEKIESANPSSIRKSLIDLMYYYERKTAEEEKKQKLKVFGMPVIGDWGYVIGVRPFILL